ncbi:MAG TPA: hypothetical protein VK571_01660 [Gemmatimonadaceae bacterium]|nr:hypothetical protein [Gemmatimonadaceae bacterium]
MEFSSIGNSDRVPLSNAGVRFPPPFLFVVGFAAGWALDRYWRALPRRGLPALHSRHRLGRAGGGHHPHSMGNDLLMGEEGAFITGSDFLMDGGVTAAYWYGELSPT